MELKYFAIGDRVQLHPATDSWMRGERYGEVVNVTHSLVIVRLDSGRVRRTSPVNILEIVG